MIYIRTLELVPYSYTTRLMNFGDNSIFCGLPATGWCLLMALITTLLSVSIATALMLCNVKF